MFLHLPEYSLCRGDMFSIKKAGIDFPAFFVLLRKYLTEISDLVQIIINEKGEV